MDLRIVITLCVTCLATVPAIAGTTPSQEPAALVEPKAGLLLPVGRLAMDVSLMVELSQGQEGVPGGIGDPISLNPDLRYGVATNLQLDLVHSVQGLTGFWDGPGGGLCALGASCVDIYGGPVGALASYQFVHGELAMAVQGGALVRKFGDALLFGAKAALKIRLRSGKVDLIGEPAISAGFNEREGSQPPNKEKLHLPIELRYSLSSSIIVHGQTGLRGFLSGLADTYQVPVTLGATYRLDARLEVGAFFGLGNVAGDGALDLRGLNIHASYRL